MRIADIFRGATRQYVETHGRAQIPGQHLRTLGDILSCRTVTQGGHVAECGHCGKRVYSYHSCRNRSCPTCGLSDTKQWLAGQDRHLLAVPYFHVVFTVPHQIGRQLRKYQHAGYGVLFQAAHQALFKVLRCHGHSHGLYGCMAVLHTWTRTLGYHPHVHMLVPSGAYDTQSGGWLGGPKHYLVPERALSSVFRALVVKKLRKSIPVVVIDQKVWEKDWVVKVLPALEHRKQVLNYLARYVKRVAISNSRIVDHGDAAVTFRYQDSTTRQWKTMTLPTLEFMSRYLQHVLPRGLTKIRYYGFLSPTYRGELGCVQQLLADSEQQAPKPRKKPEKAEDHPQRCPLCQIGRLLVVDLLPRRRPRPP